MKNFDKLLEVCDGGVTIDINPHKGFYDSVSNFVQEVIENDLPKRIIKKMEEKDSTCIVTVVPSTESYYYEVFYHYDIDKAIEEAIEAVLKYKKKKSV